MKFIKSHHFILKSLLIFFFAAFLSFTPLTTPSVFAVPDDESSETTEDTNTSNTEGDSSETSEEASTTSTENSEGNQSASCYDQVGVIGWLICPATGTLAKVIDSLYGVIEEILIIKPISSDTDTPIYIVWEYGRNITNIVFILLFIVVIYSQLTGLGFSNYNIKKTLPRIVITAILINLSFIICSIAVDLSNIIGSSLSDTLTAISETAIASGEFKTKLNISVSEVLAAVAGGGAIAGLTITFSGGLVTVFWMLIPVIFGAALSVIVGLLTISLRQAVVALLIMVSPLAFVAYLLPNTEKWFKKWQQLFSQMLIFYPMFSLLFGASRLAGWVLITSSNSPIGVILGVAVQTLPLFLAVSLLKMSGTILGEVSNRLNHLSSKMHSGVNDRIKPRIEASRISYINRGLKTNNPLRGNYWMARATSSDARVKDRIAQETTNLNNRLALDLNKLKLGHRIIGYDKNGTPIYSSKPATVNPYMRREMESRELKLRSDAVNLEFNNAFGTMSSYLKQHNIKDNRLKALTEQQAMNYLELRTQTSAKARNERGDNRFYLDKVREAVSKGEDSEEYKRLVVRGAGVGGQSEDANVRYSSIKSVIADAYIAEEKERRSDVERLTSYFDKITSKELDGEFERMRHHKNMSGIIAATEIMARRGDYDKVGAGIEEYLNNNNVELGSDDSQNLALHLLSMKEKDPTLGRLGKFINMETWRYTTGTRQEKFITMEQFITGEVRDHVTGELEENKPKLNIISALRGTPFKGIDRTSIANLKNLTRNMDESALKELYASIMPQITSALPGFDSGSEQLINTLSFLTGMDLGKDGQWSDTKRTNPNDNDPFKDRSTDFFYDRASEYLSGLTTSALINMKSDSMKAISALFLKKHGNIDDAKAAFRDIQLKNKNLERIEAGDKSALNAAKSSVLDWLGIELHQDN